MKFRLGLVVCMLVPQMLWAWTEILNGGAGFTQNGEYFTFYSSELRVRSVPLHNEDIPGLQTLLHKIQEMPANPQVKSDLLSLIYPVVGARQYYKLAAADVSSEVHRQILTEYSKLFNLRTQNLVLYAMTNQQGQTFLLPEFEKLNDIQQAAILFHEALWNLKVNIPYGDVVSAEIAAEGYFRDPKNPEAVLNFFAKLSQLLGQPTPRPEILLQAALNFDMMSPSSRVLNPMGVSLLSVLGKDFFQCYQDRSATPQNLPDCTKLLQTRLMTSSQPLKDLFPQALLAVLNNNPEKVFLCLKSLDSYRTTERFETDLDGWLQSATVNAGIFWQEYDILPPSYAPYSQINKMFKIYDGNTYWGALGICSEGP
jgi:hypothetical protein